MTRPTSLRYLKIREEAASEYGAVSSLSVSEVPYQDFSSRMNTTSGAFSSRKRTAQISAPLLRAHAALFGMLFARKQTLGGIPGHSRQTLGDVKSYNIEAVSTGVGETERLVGSKATGFQVSSTERRGGYRLAVQFLVAGTGTAAYVGSSGVDTAGYFHSGASTLRVAPAVDGNFGSTLIPFPRDISLGMRRAPVQAAAQAQLGLPREPYLGGLEEWSMSFNAVANDLRDAVRSNGGAKLRVQVRLDLGYVSRVLFIAIPDTLSSAIASTPGIGAGIHFRQKIFGVYTDGLSPFTLPGPGSTVRYQDCKGAVGSMSYGADGGYVTSIASSGTVQNNQAKTAIKSSLGGAGFPEPHAYIGLELKGGYLHTHADDWETMVPGGLSIQLDGMLLSDSEGLSNDDETYSFVLTSDHQTTGQVLY